MLSASTEDDGRGSGPLGYDGLGLPVAISNLNNED